MKHIFWLREGKIAGRSGPNSDIWDLNEIKASGFTSILSVNNGEAVHESMLSNLEIAYSNIPMSSNARTTFQRQWNLFEKTLKMARC